MTKSWRPKGWEGYVKEQRKFADMTRSIASGFSREDFEAGADAMLEALRLKNMILSEEDAEYKRVGKMLRKAREEKRIQDGHV